MRPTAQSSVDHYSPPMKRVALFLATAAIGFGCIKTEPAAQAPTPAVSQPASVVAEPTTPAEVAPSTSQTCGENDCAASEYCAFKAIGCDASVSECAPRPEMCTMDFRPVCGCDGKTYSNACAAAGAGANIEKAGECDSEPVASCGGITGRLCPEGRTCVDNPNDSCVPKKGGADCIGMCVASPQATPATCKPVRCKMFCKNGWKQGPDGCDMCSCK